MTSGDKYKNLPFYFPNMKCLNMETTIKKKIFFSWEKCFCGWTVQTLNINLKEKFTVIFCTILQSTSPPHVVMTILTSTNLNSECPN